MLNCKQITKLVSESFSRRLSVGERLRLWMHISMCRTCRSFRRLQIRLHLVMRGKPDKDDAKNDQLSQTARDRMRDVIKSNLKND